MRIQAVGQATFVVTLAGGQVLVLDPWFSEHPLARRAIPLPFGIERVAPFRALLVSHNHVDHVDRMSLRTAAAIGAAVIGPPAVARRAGRADVRDRRVLRRGEGTDLDGARVEAVYATHPLCMKPIGFFITDSDATTLYHSGDTRYDPRIVKDLAGRRVDVACVQIAAARYPVIGRDGMDVADAARLAAELGAGVAIPMHYHVRGKVEDPEGFARAAGARAHVLAPGSSLEVSRRKRDVRG